MLHMDLYVLLVHVFVLHMHPLAAAQTSLSVQSTVDIEPTLCTA